MEKRVWHEEEGYTDDGEGKEFMNLRLRYLEKLRE